MVNVLQSFSWFLSFLNAPQCFISWLLNVTVLYLVPLKSTVDFSELRRCNWSPSSSWPISSADIGPHKYVSITVQLHCLQQSLCSACSRGRITDSGAESSGVFTVSCQLVCETYEGMVFSRTPPFSILLLYMDMYRKVLADVSLLNITDPRNIR